MDRIIVAGAALLVLVGLNLGSYSLGQRSAIQSRSQDATLISEGSNESTVRYFKESTTANPAHLTDPYWLHSREYMAEGATASSASNTAGSVAAISQVDRAAVQVVTGSRTLVFPEALDGQSAAAYVGDRSINPELKVFDYAPISAPESSLHENPELKVLDYAVVAEPEASLYDNPELKVLEFPAIHEAEIPLNINPELRYLNYAASAEATPSAVDILRPWSDNR